MTALNYTETLTVVHCTCGIAFAIPESLNRLALDSERVSIYCPRGHQWHYTETTEKKLKRALDREAAVRAELDQKEASLRATKGALTKANKRIKRAEHGVCPHCNRSFVNLQRHVKTKHPECLA